MKLAPGMRLGEGQGAAAEIAEDKPGAGVGRVLQRLNAVIEQEEGLGGRRELEQQHRDGDLQKHPGDNDANGHAKPVLADRPRNQQQYRDPQQPPHLSASPGRPHSLHVIADAPTQSPVG